MDEAAEGEMRIFGTEKQQHVVEPYIINNSPEPEREQQQQLLYIHVAIYLKIFRSLL